MEKTGKESKENSESLKLRFKLFFKQDFFKSKIILWSIGLGLLLNFIDWIFIWWFIRPVDFPIILHYNVYFGVDMTGNWKRTFFFPEIGLALFFINFFLAFYFFKKEERVASYILLMASMMIQISLLIASGSIILINY